MKTRPLFPNSWLSLTIFLGIFWLHFCLQPPADNTVSLRPHFTPAVFKHTASFSDTHIPFEFILTNPASEPVQILSVEPSCNCLKNIQFQHILEAKSSLKLSGTFETGFRQGQQKKYLFVSFSNSTQALQLPLEIMIPPFVTLSPAFVIWQKNKYPLLNKQTIICEMQPGIRFDGIKENTHSTLLDVSCVTKDTNTILITLNLTGFPEDSFGSVSFQFIEIATSHTRTENIPLRYFQ